MRISRIFTNGSGAFFGKSYGQAVIASRLAQSPEGSELLLDAVAKGKASARVLQERSVTAPLEARRLPNLPERLKKLTAGLPPADAKVNALIAAKRTAFLKAKPDAAKGAVAFEKHCAACHQVAGKGAKVGGYPANFHVRNFLDCVKTREQPRASADIACQAHIACHAANIALFLNRKVVYEPKKNEFPGDEEANRLRSEALREPWRIS